MLKKKRNIKPKRVSDYNEMVELIKNREVVIYVEGDAYQEIKYNAKKSIKHKGNKTFGITISIISLFLAGPLGWMALISGGALAINGAVKDDFKKYKIKMNKEYERVELYLNKGAEKYDPKFDTIV